MDRQRYYDRKQYAEQARKSFDEHSEKRKSAGYEYGQEGAEAREAPKSYFKIRLSLAAVLFVGFCLIRFAGWTYGDISAGTIQDAIQTGIALPESFPQISDLVHYIDEN